LGGFVIAQTLADHTPRGAKAQEVNSLGNALGIVFDALTHA